MATTDDQYYLPFGKELAANEKKNRDKAIRALKRYLAVGGGSLTDLDLIKLWKGLFYCFWMSDKPLIQQALANDLGALILEVPEDNVIPFIRAFWEVHCSEWHGLDRLRLDKYLLLFRRFMFYSFSWLATHEWDEDKVEAFTKCLLEGPLHPTDRKKPDSIMYHIIDLYFEELDKVMDLHKQQLTDDDELIVPLDSLKRPMIVLSTDALNKTTRTKAKQALKEYEAPTQQDDNDNDDEDENMEYSSDEDDDDDEDDNADHLSDEDWAGIEEDEDSE